MNLVDGRIVSNVRADDTVALLQAVLEKPPLTLAEAAGTPFPPSIEAFIEVAAST